MSDQSIIFGSIHRSNHLGRESSLMQAALELGIIIPACRSADPSYEHLWGMD